jgi:hypothetical protein
MLIFTLFFGLVKHNRVPALAFGPKKDRRAFARAGMPSLQRMQAPVGWTGGAAIASAAVV